MNEEQPLIQEVPAEACAIGARLREAREALELSREEVALELHLSAAQIAHLENENFAHFPAPIFVSGYLRKYARLLGIPGEPLVEAFEHSGIEPPSLHADLTSGMPRPRRVNLEYWAGVLVGVGVIILLLVWFFAGEKNGAPLSSASVKEALPAPAVKSPPRSQTEPRPLPAPPVAMPRSVVPEAAVAPPAVEDTAAQAPVAHHRLVLHFSADSWVEISDGSGRRLMFGLGKAGQTRVLEGSAPFSILLGYAPGVEIEYNGKPYDHRRHIRNNVARFKLGGPEAVTRP